MSKNYIETDFIKKCERMSFHELLDYIKKNLENLLNKNQEQEVPSQKELYNSLLNLARIKLKNAFDYERESFIREYSKYLNFQKVVELTETVESFKYAKERLMEADLNSIKNAIVNLLEIECSKVEIVAILRKSSIQTNEKLNFFFENQDQFVREVRAQFRILEFKNHFTTLSNLKLSKMTNPKKQQELKKQIGQIEKMIILQKSSQDNTQQSHYAGLLKNILKNEKNLDLIKYQLEQKLNKNLGIEDKRRFQNLKDRENNLENKIKRQKQNLTSIQRHAISNDKEQKNEQKRIEILESRLKKLEEQYLEISNPKLSKTSQKLYNQTINSLYALTERIIEQIIFNIKKLKIIKSRKEDETFLLKPAENTINSLRNKIDDTFKTLTENLAINHLSWDLFSKGEWQVEQIVKLFKSYKWNKSEFDEDRLRSIIKSLRPNICYIGKENFQAIRCVLFRLDK